MSLRLFPEIRVSFGNDIIKLSQVDTEQYRMEYNFSLLDTFVYGYQTWDTKGLLLHLKMAKICECIIFNHKDFKDTYDDLRKAFLQKIETINYVIRCAKLIYERVLKSGYEIDAERHSVAGVTTQNLVMLLPYIQELVRQDKNPPRGCNLDLAGIAGQ